jgi:hypothetical protein
MIGVAGLKSTKESLKEADRFNTTATAGDYRPWLEFETTLREVRSRDTKYERGWSRSRLKNGRKSIAFDPKKAIPIEGSTTIE